MENPDYWRTIRDKLSGKEVVLTDDQVDMIHKLQRSSYPERGMEPYAVRGSEVVIEALRVVIEGVSILIKPAAVCGSLH